MFGWPVGESVCEVKHIPCIACGYDLYSMPLSTCCPECGLAVRESFDPRRLHFFSVKALQILQIALYSWIAAFAVFLLSPVLSWGIRRLVKSLTFNAGTWLVVSGFVNSIFSFSSTLLLYWILAGWGRRRWIRIASLFILTIFLHSIIYLYLRVSPSDTFVIANEPLQPLVVAASWAVLLCEGCSCLGWRLSIATIPNRRLGWIWTCAALTWLHGPIMELAQVNRITIPVLCDIAGWVVFSVVPAILTLGDIRRILVARNGASDLSPAK